MDSNEVEGVPGLPFMSIERELHVMRLYLKDTSEDMECLEGCDSYGHEELCPVTNVMQAFRLLRERLTDFTKENDALREAISLAWQEHEKLQRVIGWLQAENDVLRNGGVI